MCTTTGSDDRGPLARKPKQHAPIRSFRLRAPLHRDREDDMLFPAGEEAYIRSKIALVQQELDAIRAA